MKLPAYYFGTYGRPGHYLYTSNMGPVKRDSSQFPHARIFDGNFDGVLVPSRLSPYRIIVTNFEGIRYTAYSFVDYTGDSRSGSNANFFIPYDFTKYKDDLPAEFEYQIKSEFPQLYSLYKQKDVEFCFDADDTLKFKLD